LGNYTRFECSFADIRQAVESVEFMKLKQGSCAEFEVKYPLADNCYATANVAPSDTVKLHSKRVEKMLNYTRNEWGRC
jgi:hypothetical protein